MISNPTRRDFVTMAALLGAGLAAVPGEAKPGRRRTGERRNLYPQGVASGDPHPDTVILWTRRPPVGGDSSVWLDVEVAPDPSFRRLSAQGRASICAESDWTCRILAAGLQPNREYWYRFIDSNGNSSRVGRTITAPNAESDEPARFAFVSCQDPTSGALNAYRRMIYEDEGRPRDRQLGFVLHLGDFIYEVVWYPEDNPGGERGRRLRDLVRFPDGEKMRDFHLPASLEDYRTVYRAYLTDPDLQDARARWPFVCVWDNHEFSWQGWQSQQVFGGKVQPAQTKKVIANQAWFEFQPARVRQPVGMALDRFRAPVVSDAPIPDRDDLGLGLEPNNLAAIRSLDIRRTLLWGRHCELILTDNHSFRSEPPNSDAVSPKDFRWMQPREAIEILDWGKAYPGGAPSTIAYGGGEVPNAAAKAPQQSFLGAEQKNWLKDRLRNSTATWKVWGHSFGTLEWRTDIKNLPGDLAEKWPGKGYALFNGAHFGERGEIFDLIRDEKIAGFAIVAGDKHSFWAGFPSKGLPPELFEPVGVEFVTGSISSQGLFEVAEQVIPKDEPLRPLFLHTSRDGKSHPAMNMTMLHGVRAAWTLHETGDPVAARKASNPDVAPHLRFADLGGHGYATVEVTRDALTTEFVAIPRPLEPAGPDGGPIAYRVSHRAPLWKPGERPTLEQTILEGVPPLAT